MKLIDPGSDAGRFYEALAAISVPGHLALFDPVLALRLCASADLPDLERFVFLATGERRDLRSGSEDEARLYCVGVMATLLPKARRVRMTYEKVHGNAKRAVR